MAAVKNGCESSDASARRSLEFRHTQAFLELRSDRQIAGHQSDPRHVQVHELDAFNLAQQPFDCAQDIGSSGSLVDRDPFADVVLEERPQLVEIALEKN